MPALKCLQYRCFRNKIRSDGSSHFSEELPAVFSNCEEWNPDLFEAIEIPMGVVSRGNENFSSTKEERDPAL